MKLRAQLELEVPDEVGEKMLSEEQPIKLDVNVGEGWTYWAEVPLAWERADSVLDSGRGK